MLATMCQRFNELGHIKARLCTRCEVGLNLPAGKPQQWRQGLSVEQAARYCTQCFWRRWLMPAASRFGCMQLDERSGYEARICLTTGVTCFSVVGPACGMASNLCRPAATRRTLESFRSQRSSRSRSPPFALQALSQSSSDIPLVTTFKVGCPTARGNPPLVVGCAPPGPQHQSSISSEGTHQHPWRISIVDGGELANAHCRYVARELRRGDTCRALYSAASSAITSGLPRYEAQTLTKPFFLRNERCAPLLTRIDAPSTQRNSGWASGSGMSGARTSPGIWRRICTGTGKRRRRGRFGPRRWSSSSA